MKKSNEIMERNRCAEGMSKGENETDWAEQALIGSSVPARELAKAKAVNANDTETPLWRKLIPFALRSRMVMVGRERLFQYRKKLAFLMITSDISDNSKKEVMASFDCPVFQMMTMEEVAEVFGFKGTKIVGFLRSGLSNKIASGWKTWKIRPESVK